MAGKSQVVESLDRLQDALQAILRPLGFRRKGRTFYRIVDGDMRQIVALQAGPFEIGPPLPPVVEHLRPDLYGRFTVNLGVYVPECYERFNPPVKAGRVITDAHCDIRTRLGVIALGGDWWWLLSGDPDELVDEMGSLLLGVGIPFLDRFVSRDLIVRDWVAINDTERRFTNIARLDVAMIRLKQGEPVTARDLFAEHLAEYEKNPRNPGHGQIVRELAARLGLGELD